MAHKDLSHLSKEQIEELIKRYYAGENIKSLLEEFDIKVSPSVLVTLFPETESKEVCEFCGSHLMHVWVGRSSLNPVNEKDYCPTCGHRPHFFNCYCPHCEEQRRIAQQKAEEERKAEIERKRKLVVEFASADKPTANFQALPLTDRINLGTLLFALYDGNTNMIRPYRESEEMLFGDSGDVIKIYKELIDKSVIRFNPFSNLDAFSTITETNISYDMAGVSYLLNVNIPDTPTKDLAKRVMGFDKPFSVYTSEKNELMQIWKNLIIDECINYFDYELNKVRFPFNPGEKTRFYLAEMLKDYSVREVYYFIYMAIKSASRLYLEGGISKTYATNIAVKTCKTYADKAKEEHWTFTPYNKPANLFSPASFSFFFNNVVRIGESQPYSLPNFGMGKDGQIEDFVTFEERENGNG